MGQLLSSSSRPREFRLMAVMNPEHTITWPDTWQDLVDYLQQLHPNSRHIEYCIFMTALGEKRVYNESTYAAIVPAVRVYDGNIQVYSCYLWRTILHHDYESFPNYSSHLHLTPSQK